MEPLPPPKKGFHSLIEWIKDTLVPAVNMRTPLRSETCEVHEDASGTQILPRVSALTGSATSSAVCNLFCSLTNRNGRDYVSITWGTINGRQPQQMNASVPAELALGGGTRYVYAYADYQASSGQWVAAGLFLSSSSALINSKIRGYVQIGVATYASGAYNVSGSCGNVTIDPCALAAA